LQIEKFEKMLEKVFNGEIGLIGMREAPWQKVEQPKFKKIWELKKELIKKRKYFSKPSAPDTIEQRVEKNADGIPIDSGDTDYRDGIPIPTEQ